MIESGSSSAVAAFRPGRGAVRHVRAMAASLACVVTAFGAHAASGGQIGPMTVMAAFLASGALAWLIAGVRLTRLQLLGLLVLCQVGVHAAAMASHVGEPAAMGVSMLVTHAAATVLSLAALSRGEAFVWAVAERLALRPLLLLLHCFATPPTGAAIVSIPATRPREVPSLRLAHVRGPPTDFASVVMSS
ncbi:MAG: hypothetical protein WB508_00710 [Aeromicrobium sp.]|uniref:hypothetical protein n=1 Tax=Aeromicrobium sp. TaxID=1871063 RepID=UPI003C37A9AB